MYGKKDNANTHDNEFFGVCKVQTYKWCENQSINRMRHSMSKLAIFSKRARTAPATTAGKAPGRA